jgi:hypothetical protein
MLKSIEIHAAAPRWFLKRTKRDEVYEIFS